MKLKGQHRTEGTGFFYPIKMGQEILSPSPFRGAKRVCEFSQSLNLNLLRRNINRGARGATQICLLPLVVQIWCSLHLAYHQFVLQIGLGHKTVFYFPSCLLDRQIVKSYSKVSKVIRFAIYKIFSTIILMT